MARRVLRLRIRSPFPSLFSQCVCALFSAAGEICLPERVITLLRSVSRFIVLPLAGRPQKYCFALITRSRDRQRKIAAAMNGGSIWRRQLIYAPAVAHGSRANETAAKLSSFYIYWTAQWVTG
jgi:hypothetical protein